MKALGGLHCIPGEKSGKFLSTDFTTLSNPMGLAEADVLFSGSISNIFGISYYQQQPWNPGYKSRAFQKLPL